MRHKLAMWWNAIFSYPAKHIETQQPSHDSYWESRGRTKPQVSPWQKQRADIFLRHVQEGSFSVSDIGCGDGSVLGYIKEKREGMTGVGVDGSSNALKHVREAGFVSVEADISDTDIVFPQADYTLLFEIIEHVPHAELLLARAREASTKGVCISIPNTGFFTYRLRMLFGSFPTQWIQHPSEHVRFWTLRDIKWWLNVQGIEGRVYTYEGVPILKHIIPSLFAAGIVVYIAT